MPLGCSKDEHLFLLSNPMPDRVKHSFMTCRYITKSFIEIPPCAKKVIFIIEFAIWCKNPPFYEVRKNFQKRLCAWRTFKVIFSRPLFINIFWTKILFSGPYSILTGHNKVESVAYWVFSLKDFLFFKVHTYFDNNFKIWAKQTGTLWLSIKSFWIVNNVVSCVID